MSGTSRETSGRYRRPTDRDPGGSAESQEFSAVSPAAKLSKIAGNSSHNLSSADLGFRRRVVLSMQQSAGGHATTRALAAVQREPLATGVTSTPPVSLKSRPDATSTSTAASNADELVCREQLHVIKYQGTEYAIPESQWPGFIAGLKKSFSAQIQRPLESRMQLARGLYNSMKELNEDQWAVAWFLEAVRTGINLDEVAPLITKGEAAVSALREASGTDDLAKIEAVTRTTEEKVEAAYEAINRYRDLQIRTGETTVVVLQVTQTVCFTIFAVAGGAVLAAPVAAGGLGMGALSSGAIMGGGTALLSSAAAVGGKALAGDQVGIQDLRNVTIETLAGAAGGALGAGVAARLAPYLAPALTRALIANGAFPKTSEAVLAHVVRSVVSGSASGAVQGAVADGVRVLDGRATLDQLLRNVVVNLLAGALVGAIAARLTMPSPVEGLPRTGSATKPDPYHDFPDSVDAFATDGTRFQIPTRGPGGAIVGESTLIQVEGSYVSPKTGKPVVGVFEWIISKGSVTHRRFIPGGSITGRANQIPGGP